MAESTTESQDPQPVHDPLDQSPSEDEERRQKRARILEAIGGGNLGTMELKVAWILNNYPEARDSDIKLQLAYWSEFEDYDGGAMSPEDLFRRSRLTSLTPCPSDFTK